MRLDLSEAESEVLARRLSSEYGDLRMEIANTESEEWRDALKSEEQVLLRILNALGVTADELSQRIQPA